MKGINQELEDRKQAAATEYFCDRKKFFSKTKICGGVLYNIHGKDMLFTIASGNQIQILECMVCNHQYWLPWRPNG